jgi:rubrerythrin
MSIALQAEREAIRRYSDLAVQMHEADNESAAALFERMVTEEQEHERLLLEWMAQEGIEESPGIAPIKWRDPQVSTTYDDDARDPGHSTPYRALAFAVHNEEIAFRFYTHVAANSENKSVRKYAEVLAREELGHAALLRAERRRAYHAEREASMVEPRLNSRAVHNETDLLAAAIHIDRYLMNAMERLNEDFSEINALAKQLLNQLSRNKHMLNDNISSGGEHPGEDITSSLEEITSYNEKMETKVDTPKARLQRLCACCDRSFAFYDAVVETTTDEKVMLAAQKLTSSALDRIGILKDALGEQCGCTE